MMDSNNSWSNYSPLLDYSTVTSANASLMPDPSHAYILESSRFWVKRVCLPIVMCTGVIGNVITIVVLTRRRMRSSTNHYLTALAFFDMFYLIFAFSLALDDYPQMKTTSFFEYQCYAIMLNDACSNISVWLTVAFTIERYVAVCHPMKGKVFCTRSRAKKVVLGVTSFCCFVVIPTSFEHKVVEVVDDATNTVVAKRVYSALGENETYKTVYYWFSAVAFTFLPLALLAIFNTYLIRSVHQSKTTRRKMTMRDRNDHHARQEHRITVMLIAVVIMFMFCQMPMAGIVLYTSFHTPVGGSAEDSTIRVFGNIGNLLVAINAACNFVLYCALSDKYRRTFLHTFVPCLFTRSSSPRHSMTNFNSMCTQYEGDTLGVSTCGSFRQKRHSVKSSCRRLSHKDINGTVNGPKAVVDKEGFLKIPAGSNGTVTLTKENGVTHNHINHSNPTCMTDINLSELDETRNSHCNQKDHHLGALSRSTSSMVVLTNNVIHTSV